MREAGCQSLCKLLVLYASSERRLAACDVDVDCEQSVIVQKLSAGVSSGLAADFRVLQSITTCSARADQH